MTEEIAQRVVAEAAAALERGGVGYVLIGGVASSVRFESIYGADGSDGIVTRSRSPIAR